MPVPTVYETAKWALKEAENSADTNPQYGLVMAVIAVASAVLHLTVVIERDNHHR